MNEVAGRLIYIAPVFVVRDLHNSIAFYRDQLGFEIDFTYDSFYASVSRDNCHIHLRCGRPTQRDQAALARDESIDASISVMNAEALAAAYESAGVTFAQTLRQMPYGLEFYV